MKWFYNLRRLYRNIIAGALWGVLLLVAGIAGGIYGDNVDNMHPAVAVVVVALLVGAIVFTVFASIATKNERRANNQVINNLPRERTPDVSIDTQGISASLDNAEIHTKAVGVTFDDCQDNIGASVIGDKLVIKHAPVDKYIESTDIINARTNKRIGRIKKELAFELLDQFGKGFSHPTRRHTVATSLYINFNYSIKKTAARSGGGFMLLSFCFNVVQECLDLRFTPSVNIAAAILLYVRYDLVGHLRLRCVDRICECHLLCLFRPTVGTLDVVNKSLLRCLCRRLDCVKCRRE